MKRYIIKILTMIIMILIFVNFCTVISNAGGVADGTGSSAISEFVIGAENQNTGDNKPVTSLKNIMGAIRAVVQVISIAVAVIMLIVLSIKYMYSSVSERAEIKKHAVIYVIGAIIIFSVNGILAIIQSFSSNIK